MTAKYETISLSQIANQVAEMVGEAPALQPGRENPVIVERLSVKGKDRLEIVDGFHRAAGYCLWASAEGRDYSDVQIRVLVADDADLIADAAEPGPKQAAAIEALYASAE